jgi:hypothetical protein
MPDRSEFDGGGELDPCRHAWLVRICVYVYHFLSKLIAMKV